MLHTKLCGKRPAGFGEEDIKGFLPYMGMAAILVMRPASCRQIFISFKVLPESIHTKFGPDRQSSF